MIDAVFVLFLCEVQQRLRVSDLKAILAMTVGKLEADLLEQNE